MIDIHVNILTTGRHSMDDDDLLRAETAVWRMLDEGNGHSEAARDFEALEELTELEASGADLTFRQADDLRNLMAWHEELNSAATIAATEGWMDPNGLHLEVTLIKGGTE